MSAGPSLHWLPSPDANWKQLLNDGAALSDDASAWAALCGLAQFRLDFIATQRLDHVARQRFPSGPPSSARRGS